MVDGFGNFIDIMCVCVLISTGGYTKHSFALLFEIDNKNKKTLTQNTYACTKYISIFPIGLRYASMLTERESISNELKKSDSFIISLRSSATRCKKVTFCNHICDIYLYVFCIMFIFMCTMYVHVVQVWSKLWYSAMQCWLKWRKNYEKHGMHSNNNATEKKIIRMCQPVNQSQSTLSTFAFYLYLILTHTFTVSVSFTYGTDINVWHSILMMENPFFLTSDVVVVVVVDMSTLRSHRCEALKTPCLSRPKE